MFVVYDLFLCNGVSKMSFISFAGGVILVVMVVLGIAYAVEAFSEDNDD